MPVIFMLLGALFLFLLQQRFYSKHWSDGLDAELSFLNDAVTEGDEGTLSEVIINRKRLPLATLQIKFSVSKYLVFTETENTITTDQQYRSDIFSLRSYEKITRRLPFKCTKRGLYHIDDIDVLSGDIFFSKKLISVIKQHTHMYVYPKPVDSSSFSIPFQQLMGTILSRKYNYEDPFEFRGIRNYEIYDPLKDINWKASARTGELMVNQHNYASSQKVVILLTLEANNIWKYERLYEESIRLAAAFANACISNGIPVGLISNAFDCETKKPIQISASAGDNHKLSIMQLLARIDATVSGSEFFDIVDNELDSSEASSTVYILISREQRQNVLQAFEKLSILSPGAQWIAPLHPGMEMKKELCPSARSPLWEVPYGS